MLPFAAGYRAPLFERYGLERLPCWPPAGSRPEWPGNWSAKLGHLRRRVIAGKYFGQTKNHKNNRWSVASVDHMAADEG